MTESFAELFEQSQVESKMRLGSILSGTVVDVFQDNVIVSAGLKSESWIPIDQFYDEKGELEVAIGDEVEVALDAVEDGYGETRLSREKAKRLLAWTNLERAHDSDETVTGVITERVKGGFTVDVEGIRAFLPGSLVDVRPVKDTVYLEGKPLDFKVIKIDQKRSNVVVSRRAVVESENIAERQSLIDKLKEGVTVTGVVKNLTDYGAFLDLGGIDGLLHITDMAWKRVKDPADIVNIGDEIEVKVLKFDRERNRVSLGLKQMGDDPWGDLTKRFPEGSRLHGAVTNLADYGCFVELEEGVEGLVHVSEMDWTNKNIHPSKLVQTGDQVDVIVLDIDQERRRISLGMKQCQPNPWEEFAALHNKGDRVSGQIKSITDFGIFIDQERRRISLGMKQCQPNPWEEFAALHNKGDRVSGQIKSITDFGIFIGLPGGIDGLVHLSDVSWVDEGEDALRNYKKGTQIETVVLAVDTERERISLGIKQLERDPFTAYVAENPKGAVVTGKINAIETRNIVVELAQGVEGQLKISELSGDKKARDAKSNGLKEDDEIEVKITAVDRKKRTISVSVKAKESDEESAAIKEYTPDSSSGAKLGDLLKKHLDSGGSS
jgi:small subunit ribosomal protein S1